MQFINEETNLQCTLCMGKNYSNFESKTDAMNKHRTEIFVKNKI